jgi:hypothetical protein
MLLIVNIEVIRQAAVSRLYFAIASQKIAYMTGSAATPPCSSGTSIPSQPLSAAFL